MHALVGSTNPVKLAAVERALAPFELSVEAVDVPSGVAKQPWTVAETVEGAENRARRALEAGTPVDATPDRAVDVLGVGLEGGVARPGPLDDLYLIMWAAVTDGRRLERGAGPSLRLPDAVAARLEADGELGPVMDDLLGTEGVAEERGAAGALTGGLTDREAALGQAVAAAVGPFVSEHYEVD